MQSKQFNPDGESLTSFGEIENTTINVLLDVHNNGNSKIVTKTPDISKFVSNDKNNNLPICSLHIDNLSFESSVLSFKQKIREFSLNYKLLNPIVSKIIPEKNENFTSICKVNFKINSGTLTTILGDERSGREILTQLIANRVRLGVVEGDINVQGNNISSHYSDNIAFVPKEFVYMTGLTYEETLFYAATLRMTGELQSLKAANKNTYVSTWRQIISERVEKILTIMNLQNCRQKRIEDKPAMRGIEGGELRRLSIAVQIIHLPPIIIIDNPSLELETTIAVEIFQTLKVVAAHGHVVVCSMAKPSQRIFNMFDSVVLMSQGFSIYAGPIVDASKFFCSSTLGYEVKENVDTVDFLVDISSGTERSAKSREAISPFVLQNTFEMSPIYEAPALSKNAISFLSKKKIDSFDVIWFRTTASISRALKVKWRDTDTTKKIIGSSILAGLFTGYLQFGQGNIGNYSLSLLKLPYATTSNITALLFFSSGFIFSQQAVNVHVICQRLLVYRYEQSAKCCPTASFTIAFLISEIPFVLFSTLIFGTLIFFLGKLGFGIGDYMFFIESMWSIALIGLIVATLFASLFVYEYTVRELYIASTFFMLLISGFPFQLTNITPFFSGISVLNPVRWSFQCLMNWKFGQNTSKVLDGVSYLQTFFDHPLQKDDLFVALSIILVVLVICLFYSLMPYNNYIRRKDVMRPTTRDSIASDVGSEEGDGKFRLSFRRSNTSELHKPLIYTKQSSVSSKSRLSVSVSQTGENVQASGETIAFKNIDYYIKERSGVKHVLHNVSGQFDWGSLSAIMGGAGSGKSSLLHVLAGDRKRSSTVTGSILINNKPIDPTIPLWRRCAFVDTTDEFHLDLTVEEIMTLAMQLRCLNRKGLRVVKDNVESTIKILHLESSRNKMAKDLTPGERRLLSIAEEIVSGPSILMIDEALTGLDSYDTTTLLGVFRELVNEDRTVVASLHQPSAEAFSVFDSLLLLSEGRIIYWGRSDNVINFFMASPLGFDFSVYSNPIDFITDVSSCNIRGRRLFPEDLKNNFDRNELGINKYKNLENYFKNLDNEKNRIDTNSNMEMSSVGLTSFSSPSFSFSNSVREMRSTISCNAIIGRMKSMLTFEYWDLFTFKKRFLFVRAWKSLLGRRRLILLTLFLHIVLAFLFYFIIGQVGYSQARIYNCTSFFAVSTLLILFMNLIYVPYLDASHRVFLKEYDRQLYSTLDNWMLSWIPMSTLIIICAIIFAGISSKLLHLNTETKYYNAEGTYILITLLSAWAGEQMSECIVNIVPNMRAAYILIPALAFIQFSVSGLFLKFQSLHDWLLWAPTTSIIRWALQANFINNYEKNRKMAATSPIFYAALPFDFNAFKGVLQLFSWDSLFGPGQNVYYLGQDDDDLHSINDDSQDSNKSIHYRQKWFCISMLFVLVVIFRFLSYFCSYISGQIHKGGRFANA